MKKTLALIIAVSCLAVIAGCADSTAANASQSSTIQASEQLHVENLAVVSTSLEYIGEDAAKAAALEHSGLTESEVTYIRSKLDYDDGRWVYDIEFYCGNTEYDYELDAYTGEIVSYDFDVDNYVITSTAPIQSSDGVYIGEDAAKDVVLEHSGLDESEVTYITVKLDYDDGRWVYDIEFYHGNKEYDYVLDAYTGEIVSYDFDIEDYAITSTEPIQNNDETHIGLDEAKSIALSKADMTEDQVTYTETSFEYDDGIAVYQIDFVSGGMEYEYEIDAVSGIIVEYDVESQYD